MLGGSGCQGKRSCQENREETTGTRTAATNQGAVRSTVPVQRSGTALPPMGVSGVWQGMRTSYNVFHKFYFILLETKRQSENTINK